MCADLRLTVHTVCANFLDLMLGRGPKFSLLPSRGRVGVGRAWKIPHRIRLSTSFGLKHSLGISYLEGKVPPSLGSVQDLTSLMPLKCTFCDFAFLNWRLYGGQPWPLASAVFLLDPIFYRTNPVFLCNQFSSAFCSSRYLSFTQRPDP